MSDQPSSDRVLERLGGALTKVTAIIAAVVALNTAVTTCANDRVARAAAFRQAVAVEEAYWKGLYDDYLTTFDETIAKDPERRRAKLFAVSNLANHDIPAFEEHSVSGAAKAQATARLVAMRKSLVDALQDTRASGAAVAEASKSAAFAADEAGKVRDRSDSAVEPPIPTAAQSAAPVGSLSYQTQVLARGSKTGWDVDVFWCQGQGEEQRFTRAQAAAQALARKAEAGEALATGVALGRIRLRSLPIAYQARPETPSNGDIVLYDARPGEAEAAAAVRGVLSAAAGPFGLARTPSRSAWYLSAFVCPTGGPAAPIAAPAPAME